MPDELLSVTIAPSFTEWGSILAASSRRADPELRRSVIEAARSFTAGLPLAGDGADPVSPLVVATGHQAVIYHPGILFKNRCIDALSARSGVTALNVIIDTDVAECGLLKYPVGGPSGPRIHAERIAEGNEVSLGQSLLPAKRLSEAFSTVGSELRRLGKNAAADNVQRARELYEKIAGCDIVSGNTSIRRALSRATHLEVPISRLIRLPRVAAVLAEWIIDHERFFTIYNDTLAALRAERGIRNRANPFPDLKRSDKGKELPFWTIRDGARSPLFVAERDGRVSLEGIGEASSAAEIAGFISEGPALITPRAVPISILLRCHVSDLFVHGLGGSRYDLFTDRFIEAYLGITAPRFAIASATKRLFEDEIRRYEKEHLDAETFRKIVYHLGAFGDRPEIAAMPDLDDAIEIQRGLIERIKTNKAIGQSSALETRRLKEHMLRVAGSVRRAFAGRTIGGSADPNYLSAIYCRELPFFFFDSDLFQEAPIETDQ